MQRVQSDNITLYYAKALFNVSMHKLDVITKELDFVLNILKNQNNLLLYLANPILSLPQKKELILCFKDYISSNLISFFVTILINKRSHLLQRIIERFLLMVKKEKNEIEVIITSAVSLQESDISIITESMCSLGEIVKAENVVDQSLLGGFSIRYGFNVIDLSLKNYLNKLVDYSKVEILEYIQFFN
ncbi:ATP synthase F1 subunit delta [Wolbachia endosymbiont of Pentidionis agamae]|uniref:ATP synthase F1 subunit delta n=1 Tax=Wolbachia endosymbiont of Pentidionis agamae TaxID=3110435 RepID=UPI002FD20BDB